MKFTAQAILAAAAIAIAAPAAATTAGTPVADDTVTTIPADRDDDDFPWGLLGLIGLAGLLGRKRHDDVRVDRTDNIRR